jgi:putative tricarboxylic transport membrane protein
MIGGERGGRKGVRGLFERQEIQGIQRRFSVKFREGNTGDTVASIFGILLGGVVMIGAIRLHLGTPREPQPGFFPFVAALILVVLCGILLVQALYGRRQGMEAFGELWRPVILIAGLFVYAVVLDVVGYVVATTVLSAVVLRVLDTKTWWKLLVISLALSIGTYILFDRLLDVSLPEGVLAELI